MSPPGASTAAASGRHSQGASMSRITRSKEAPAGSPESAADVPDNDSRAAGADRSPVTSRHQPGVSPKYFSTFAAAIAAKSGRRSNDTSRPDGPAPTARSSQQDSAPDPAPASSTRAPGKMSAQARICAAAFGETIGGPR